MSDLAKLAKDMTRRCSHCGHNGHNSRTCPDRGVKLFGVRLTIDGLMRKSVSMGNLSSTSSNSPLTPEQSESRAAEDGYVSDGLVQTSEARERKKGVPWTEEEHKMFLLGLQKLGKGDWRGISRNFVTSRTPTQVASHAQKYFLRQSSLNKRKRRSSLFDISADTVEESIQSIPELSPEIHDLSLGPSSSLPSSGNFFEMGVSPNLAMCVGTFSVSTLAPSRGNNPPLSFGRSRIEEPDENKMPGDEGRYAYYLKLAECRESGQISSKSPFPLPLWPKLTPDTANMVKPSVCISPDLEESAENSGLNLSIAPPSVDPPPPLSHKLEQPPRHSAFHSNDVNSNSSAISVV